KIDPYHMQDPWLTSGASYSLDSIEIDYAYLRTLAPSVIDTLFISLLKTNTDYFHFLSGTDSVYFWNDIGYDDVSNGPKSVDIWETMTQTLSEADSSNTARPLVLPI